MNNGSIVSDKPNKKSPPPIRNRSLSVLLVSIATLVAILFSATTFVSFSIHNGRQQEIILENSTAYYGIIFRSPSSLKGGKTAQFWALIPGSTPSLGLSIRSNSNLEHLTCSIDRRGSDYCEIDIAENGIDCTCYQ